MAKLSVNASEFARLLTTAPTKLYDALVRALGWDYKSAWTAKPTDGKFNHGLSVVPLDVRVQGSDQADGSDYVQENATSVNATSVTVGGSKAYYRVLANR